MPTPQRRTWWGLAVAAALAIAACSSDTTGPSLSNPAQVNADLQTISSVFQTSIFASFSGVIGTPGTPAHAAPFRGLALVGGTAPTALATSARPYVDGPARLAALRRVALAVSPSAAALAVVPDTLKGWTFVWNPDSVKYLIDSTRTDADPSGVRIELYVLDNATGLPAGNPATVVGDLDLIDQSTDVTYTLRVLLTGAGSPLGNYADYTISATTQGTPVTFFQASAVGHVSDGQHRLDFNATFTATNPSSPTPTITVSVTWTLDNPTVSLVVNETVTWQDANNLTFSISNTVAHGQTIGLDGTVSVAISPTDTIPTFNLTLRVNGGVFARLVGTAPNLQVSPSTLSGEPLLVLLNMTVLAAQVEDVMERLFHPLEHFVT